jgi:hypothetical protein
LGTLTVVFTSLLPNCRPIKRLKAKTVLGVYNCLSLGRQANMTFAVLGERDDRGRGPCAFQVLDDAEVLPSMTVTRVGHSQVNTDNRAYKIVSIIRKKNDT